MPWLTTVEAARILGRDAAYVRYLIATRKLRCYRRNVDHKHKHWLRASDVYHYRATHSKFPGPRTGNHAPLAAGHPEPPGTMLGGHPPQSSLLVADPAGSTSSPASGPMPGPIIPAARRGGGVQ